MDFLGLIFEMMNDGSRHFFFHETNGIVPIILQCSEWTGITIYRKVTSLTHSHTRPPSHSLTHSLIHARTHTHTHARTYSTPLHFTPLHFTLRSLPLHFTSSPTILYHITNISFKTYLQPLDSKAIQFKNIYNMCV